MCCNEVFSPLPTDEGAYINASGGRIKDVRLQWGEVPSSIGMHYVMITVSLLLRDRGRGCKNSDYNSPIIAPFLFQL